MWLMILFYKLYVHYAHNTALSTLQIVFNAVTDEVANFLAMTMQVSTRISIPWQKAWEMDFR